MIARDRETTYLSISIAVQQSGLSRQAVLECVERRLIAEPLTEQDLVELRRIRRLGELGVNMPGIEVILHMRRRIEEMQREMARLEWAWAHSGWPDVESSGQRLLSWEPDLE